MLYRLYSLDGFLFVSVTRNSLWFFTGRRASEPRSAITATLWMQCELGEMWEPQPPWADPQNTVSLRLEWRYTGAPTHTQQTHQGWWSVGREVAVHAAEPGAGYAPGQGCCQHATHWAVWAECVKKRSRGVGIKGQKSYLLACRHRMSELWFQCPLFCFWSNSLLLCLEKQQKTLACLDPCHSRGNPRWSSGTWLHCGPIDGKSEKWYGFSLFLPLHTVTLPFK